MHIEEIRTVYLNRLDYLKTISSEIETHLRETLKEYPRIDRISARAKSIERFMGKAVKEEKGTKKYSDPLNQIQDQIGARIITFYLEDVKEIAKFIDEYYKHIENRTVVPDSESEFGYEGKHYILFIPDECIEPDFPEYEIPKFFELQIKTLYQHAWSEANHDLGYKQDRVLDAQERRQIAFTAAQSWGADHIFNELFTAESSLQ